MLPLRPPAPCTTTVSSCVTQRLPGPSHPSDRTCQRRTAQSAETHCSAHVVQHTLKKPSLGSATAREVRGGMQRHCLLGTEFSRQPFCAQLRKAFMLCVIAQNCPSVHGRHSQSKCLRDYAKTESRTLFQRVRKTEVSTKMALSCSGEGQFLRKLEMCVKCDADRNILAIFTTNREIFVHGRAKKGVGFARSFQNCQLFVKRQKKGLLGPESAQSS